jgi:hypothetical protein
MKKNLHYFSGEYQSPVMTETLVSIEGVLCASSDSEKFEYEEDQDGWDAN